jgi:drug/metabolite transporter (DMT)-like permease
MASSDRRASTVLGFAAILLWSTTVAFGRSLGEQLGPLTTASLIYLLGGMVGSVLLALSGKLRQVRTLPRLYLYGCGGLFVLYMGSLYLGLGLAESRIQALQIGLLNYLWPALTVLLSVPILGLRASPLLIPGALLAAAGVFVATSLGDPGTWSAGQAGPAWISLPHFLGLSAALSWALYSNLSRRWAGPIAGHAVPVFMLCTGLLLGLARLLSAESTRWSLRTVAELAFMVIGSNMAYVFWERAMRRGDIVLVATASLGTPLLSTLVSTYYLAARPGAYLWIGCAMVVCGALLCKTSVRGIYGSAVS